MVWLLRPVSVFVAMFLVVSLRASSGSTAARSSQYSIRFREDLKLSNDIRLKADQSPASLRFDCESTSKPLEGSALHLFIEHSPNIDSSRSFLSITLNYGILRSLRLDESNVRRTEVVIPLPPEMLKVENEIVFAVEQF